MKYNTIRSAEGLTLERSTFQSLYGGQFTSSTQLMNPKLCESTKTQVF